MNFSCFSLVFKYFERRILYGKYENGFQKDRTSEWCRSSTFLTGCIHWFWRSKCFLSGWPCGSVRVKNTRRSASVPYFGRQKFMGTNLSLCISNQFVWIEISMCPVCRGGTGSAGNVTGRDGFGPPVFWYCLNCVKWFWFLFWYQDVIKIQSLRRLHVRGSEKSTELPHASNFGESAGSSW